MALIAVAAPTNDAADRRAFNAYTKGKHDGLVCYSLEDLAVQLAAKHKGASTSGVLGYLRAHPECYEHDDAGVIRRTHRCNLRKRSRKGAAA